MKEIDELAAALRQAESPPEPEAAMPLRAHISRAIRNGQHEIAAAGINLARRVGRHVNDVPAVVEEIATRQRAVAGAEAFRRVNEINATNCPLPAWIRAELGETY
jgi:hypothetical protein